MKLFSKGIFLRPLIIAGNSAMKVNRDESVHAIRKAGFVPAQRRTDYSLVDSFATG